MAVNEDIVRSLLERHEQDQPTPEHMREMAAEYEEYVRNGRTYKDPRTGMNASVETLADVAAALRTWAETGVLWYPGKEGDSR
jgi:hypothetical protein